MKNIFKVLFGITLGSLITIFVYENHLKPEAINIAIQDHELTEKKIESYRKFRRIIFERQLQLRKDEETQVN